MGNCFGFGASHVSKETFHPIGDEFTNAEINTTDTNIDEEKAKQIRSVSKPLKINIGDKLQMVVEETGLEWPKGTILYKMKNKTTGESAGLIAENMVAKIGTLECEK